MYIYIYIYSKSQTARFDFSICRNKKSIWFAEVEHLPPFLPRLGLPEDRSECISCFNTNSEYTRNFSATITTFRVNRHAYSTRRGGDLHITSMESPRYLGQIRSLSCFDYNDAAEPMQRCSKRCGLRCVNSGPHFQQFLYRRFQLRFPRRDRLRRGMGHHRSPEAQERQAQGRGNGGARPPSLFLPCPL